MPKLKYTAIDSMGQRFDGVQDVNDQSQLIALLKGQNSYPIKIEEVNAKLKAGALSMFSKGVSIKDIAIFCRQFCTMIKSGITIIKALDILQLQTENKKFRKVLEIVYTDVQKGSSLSDSMRRQPIFPDLLVNMIEAGEMSGNLDSILERMAVHFEKENKIINKIRSAMVYPIVLAVAAVSVVTFLLIFILPTFIGMFSSSGVTLPGPTRLLIAISKFITNFWYLIIAFIIGLVILIQFLLRTEQGRLRWDSMKLTLPAIGGPIRKIITSRFTRTLSTLLSSGMSLMQALEITARVVGNKVAFNGIMFAREEMRKGLDLAGPIQRTGIFPPMVDSMIRIGEESGTLDEILESTALFYDEEVETALVKLTGLLEPAMLIFMAVIIGFIVISMAMPMFAMVDTVK